MFTFLPKFDWKGHVSQWCLCCFNERHLILYARAKRCVVLESNLQCCTNSHFPQIFTESPLLSSHLYLFIELFGAASSDKGLFIYYVIADWGGGGGVIGLLHFGPLPQKINGKSVKFAAWFHIVCDSYTSDYAHFTFSDTIWIFSPSWVCRTDIMVWWYDL